MLTQDSRMSGRNPQERKRGAFGMSSPLFPIPQGMNTYFHGLGEVRLGETDKAPQHRDILS